MLKRSRRASRLPPRLLHAGLLLLFACGDSAPAANVPDPREQPSSAAPTLRIGTSGDYAPFSKQGVGFDVDIAERMAKDLGYRIEWVPFTWPELKARVAANAFDVAMGGITFRPDRGVVGYMTRSVAVAGPCVLHGKPTAGADHASERVAVNRGGILERWARTKYSEAQLRTVEDNTALPDLLERGEVDAIVTDTFELTHFMRPGWEPACEPPRDRKVYWVSPARATELGPKIDAWLAAHEPELKQLRAKWLGEASEWSAAQHLIDLLARRLALMPAVAAYKRRHALPIDDPEREAVVLKQAVDAAATAGLDPDSVRALFSEQIELAKAVQRRAPATTDDVLDLGNVLRPALNVLGDRILIAITACAEQLPALTHEELDLLVPLLEPPERDRLLVALRAVRNASEAR